MKRILHIFISIILVVFLATSCTKNTDKFTPYTNFELNDVSWSNDPISEEKSQAIINALSKSPFTTSFNSLYGVQADFNNQVQLAMPGNSYSLNGVNYSGSVNVKLMQLSTKGDFIRNLVPSSGSNNLYDTKSVFLLKLTDNNGANIDLSNGNSYYLRLIDTPLTQNYVYLTGSNVPATEGSINWNIADSAKIGYLQTTTTLINGQSKDAYEIVSNKTNWISFAKPINETNFVNSNVVLSANNFTNKNTVVFAVFNNYNIVLKLQPDFVSKTFLAKKLPLGSSIKLVSISYIDGQFYLGKQDAIITNTAEYTIKPSLIPVSIIDVNSFLGGL